MSKNKKSPVLKETFKQQEKVISGILPLSAEPHSICRTAVSSSPLWCNISIATNSAAVVVRGGLWSMKMCTAQAQLKQRSHLAQVRRSRNHVGGQLRSMDGRLRGQSGTTRVWFPQAAHYYSLIAGSGPHTGSECWPLRPTGAGRWTRFLGPFPVLSHGLLSGPSNTQQASCS